MNRPSGKRRIVSCETCRRLRVRCERVAGIDICRRCEHLRIECSLHGSFIVLPTSATAASTSSLSSTDRLTGIENAIREIRQQLSAASPSRDTGPGLLAAIPPSVTVGATPNDQPVLGFGPIADMVRSSPINVVRDMGHHIAGTSPGGPAPDHETQSIPVETAITLGIVSGGLEDILLGGFTALCRHRYLLDVDVDAIRRASPLVLAACLLSGLLTFPYLYHSRLHEALYEHAKGHLSASLLHTPAHPQTLFAYMLFSRWNLMPTETGTSYIDSWVLSGTGIMHGLLSADEHQHEQRSLRGYDTSSTIPRQIGRIWDLLCLTHLQFCLGTSRPAVLSANLLRRDQFHALDPSPDDSADALIGAELDLYRRLVQLMHLSDRPSTTDAKQAAIDKWREDYSHIYEDDTTRNLPFAYSCACLIISRQALRSFSVGLAPNVNLTDIDQSFLDALIVKNLTHARQLLEEYLLMDAQHAASDFNFAVPAYDFLMISNAALTIVEFAKYLDDVRATLARMKLVCETIEKSTRPTKVFKWAVDVVTRIVRER